MQNPLGKGGYFFRLVGMLCFAAISLSAQVAYYPLDGNALDVSGHALHGTVVGATPATNRFGAPQSALSFNGVGDYVNCGASNIFCFQNNFTLSAWAKLNGPQPAKYI